MIEETVVIVDRDAYSAITGVKGMSGDAVVMARSIIASFKYVLPKTFVEFDRAGRGDALNLELYGWDQGSGCAVFQIRHAFRRTRSGYLSTHKDYVLVGLNESGTMFRHPVSAHPIRAAARIDPHDPLAPIRAAQRWMWQVTAKQLERAHGQGDVLIVPERLSPPESVPIHESEVVLGGSQFLRADTLTWFNGRQYARRPTLHHIKRQDLTIRGDNRWYSARLVREAPTCSWGTRIGD